MKLQSIPIGLATLTLFSTLNHPLSTACAQTTAFTYQGQLTENGGPANGSYDLTFSVWNNATGPAQVGGTITNSAVSVSNGLFTVTLDFGGTPFDGSGRWLEIGARTNGAGAFTTLSPRQQVLPTPYAIYSAGAASAATAATATNAMAVTNFSGALAGDVTGTQGATVVASVGAQSAASVASATIAANAATNAYTTNTIVKRDGSGGFSASTIRFGPSTNSLIEVQSGPSTIAGLLLRDTNSVRILHPSPTGTNFLTFGSTDNYRISVTPSSAMRFDDPLGFVFNAQVTVNGPIFAQAFIQTSSRRFKHDVRPIEQPLEKISRLQGVRFSWSKDKGGYDDIGFIAEDVAKVIPEVVGWEEDGQNARGVNYDHLVAVTIEGIKAQQTQIQTLKRENAELKQSVAELKAIVSNLAAEKSGAVK